MPGNLNMVKAVIRRKNAHWTLGSENKLGLETRNPAVAPLTEEKDVGGAFETQIVLSVRDETTTSTEPTVSAVGCLVYPATNRRADSQRLLLAQSHPMSVPRNQPLS